MLLEPTCVRSWKNILKSFFTANFIITVYHRFHIRKYQIMPKERGSKVVYGSFLTSHKLMKWVYAIREFLLLHPEWYVEWYTSYYNTYLLKRLCASDIHLESDIGQNLISINLVIDILVW